MTDQAAIPVTYPSVPQKGRFFIIGPDLRGGGPGHGVIIANEEKLRTPPRLIIRPEEGGFPMLRETPHLVHEPREGHMPRDLEGGLSGYWLVSARLKQVFESVDPEAFAFVSCNFTLADGTCGPRHYLCDVVRTLSALDEPKSRVRINYETDHRTGEDVRMYSIRGGASLTFDPAVVGTAHIFRQRNLGADPICDDALCEAIGMAGVKGVRLRDAANL
ncbi:DUF1629 domain-containing protein [Pseudoxanthomonas koreensis]|uniref:DUF1629 domain-containing protein n=1 Tax=Pseudoxanthomonas koreensis TaxID=266061 RepID=UPI0035A70A5E